MSNPNTKVGVRVFLTLSFISAALVGVFVYGGTRLLDESLIWAGITFIVVLVSIATLALTVKDDEFDPEKPRLK
jgi:hypothetical membrane protein